MTYSVPRQTNEHTIQLVVLSLRLSDLLAEEQVDLGQFLLAVREEGLVHL